MKLHTVFITYNRLELTKQAIASYLETVSVPFSISLVDNHSQDGTWEWIFEEFWKIAPGGSHHILDKNRYPGYATNVGFADAPEDATHLQRADNDFVFLPGWCEVVQHAFRNPDLGQLGLRTNEEEDHNLNNVGGNCVIRRELWEQGLRYDERPWPQLASEVGRGWSEDSLLSPQVKALGYHWQRVKRPCIRATANANADDPYYVQSLADRGVEL